MFGTSEMTTYDIYHKNIHYDLRSGLVKINIQISEVNNV
jgi:hypothetical protein